MRVLMVSAHGNDPTSGGVERLLTQLSDLLAGRGLDVGFLQAFPPRISVGDFERTVLHRTDWREDSRRRLQGHLGDILAWPSDQLKTAVAHHRPDVVHTHNLPGISTGIWEVCRRLGLPVVHSLHDYYLFCPRVTLMTRDATPCRPSPLLCGVRTRRLARWSSAASQVIGVSQYILDLHAPLFPRAEFHLIRHPIAVPGSVERGPPPVRPTVLGYIGSLERIKGVHLLLEAASRLAPLGLTLRIAGDGHLRDEVERAVRRGENVVWDGPVRGERKDRFFAECDLGLVPSVWAEPGGPTFTMVEWLAAGRPVLVSRRGGLGEVAGAYPGSIPIEPTVDSIVDSIVGLLEPARWQEALAAVRPIESGQDQEDWAGKHEELYRSMVRARSSA